MKFKQPGTTSGGYARCMFRFLLCPFVRRAFLLATCLWCFVLTQAQTQTSAVPADAAAAATPAEHLVWSDEFNQHGSGPDPGSWTYETGGGGWGNGELETYCGPGTTVAPCDPAKQPNSFVGEDGFLHIVARRNAEGQWTSARLVTHELQSFQYGRIEARIRIPKGEGVWPAFWMLGEDIKQHPWPACGEIDIMENIGKEPTQVHGTLHGPGYQGVGLGKPFSLASGKPFADGFHTYGILWSPGKVQFYVDDPAKPYAMFTPADLPKGAVWPFDQGRFFLLLNLAVGGRWPGPPDAATPATLEMLVDYVRVYQTAPAH